ncbi:hypothetical protein Nepgr_025861 [Nepenthes gracilis]|uniref:NPK1-activating kinesin-like protein C-terminal domain-containing protein n=1 Tax=Nepenthes gracilis TaxID=150966 RepID=A0AAD3T5T9_NEPGR|nr:hypothetical protein Nepgr_025861 [Nepenthes gracilis]
MLYFCGSCNNVIVEDLEYYSFSIMQLERKMQELTMQRDLALSPIKELHPVHIQQSWGSSTLLDYQSIDNDFRIFETSDSSVRHNKSVSEESYPLYDFDRNLEPRISHLNMLIVSSCDASSPVSIKRPDTFEIGSFKDPEQIEDQAYENLEEINNVETSASSLEKECIFLLMGDENTEITNQEPLELHDSDPSLEKKEYNGCESKNTNSIKSRDSLSSIISCVPQSEDGEEHEKRYSDGYDDEFMGKHQDIQRKISALRFDVDEEILSRRSCKNSMANIVTDGLQVQAADTKGLTNGYAANSDLSVAETKDLVNSKCEKEPAGRQVDVSHLSPNKPIKTVKDVGLDPQDDLDGADWPSDFKKLQCTRSLRREQEMLSKMMKRRLSKQDRQSLCTECSIWLDSKRNSSQLATRLWPEYNDVNVIKDSTQIIAKLLRLDTHQVHKEMFALNLMPRQQRQ